MMHETEKDRLHREQAAQSLSHEGRKYFRFVEFDENEQLVTEIRKHFVGLFFILLTGGLIMLAVLAAGALISSIDMGDALGVSQANNYTPLFFVLSIIVAVLAAVMTLIAAFLYRSNVIFVTSEKIAQVVYRSLFNRKISQLSIGDVQDVTVTQKGILAHFFNYGTLVIETAGEQENYTFSYVPDPYQMAKAIVGAHEKNLALHGN